MIKIALLLYIQKYYWTLMVMNMTAVSLVVFAWKPGGSSGFNNEPTFSGNKVNSLPLILKQQIQYIILSIIKFMSCLLSFFLSVKHVNWEKCIKAFFQ
jgi:hypothetical protein